MAIVVGVNSKAVDDFKCRIKREICSYRKRAFFHLSTLRQSDSHIVFL